MRLQRPGLSALFPNLTRTEFLNRHWPARPTWGHGAPARLSRLTDIGQIDAVMTLALRSHVEMKAMFPAAHNESNEIAADASSARALYDSGATIACNAVHRWHAVVGLWSDRLARELSVPADRANCNLYMTPRGRGVRMHFDDHEIIVVQLAGRKRWRIAENHTVVNPVANSGVALTDEVRRYATAPAPRRMTAGRTVTLKPGSVLFLPRGYWHSTDAQEASISLTFGFRVPSWAEIVGTYIGNRLTAQTEWRAPAWPLFQTGAPDADARRQWRALRGHFAALVDATELGDLVRADSSVPRAFSRRRR